MKSTHAWCDQQKDVAHQAVADTQTDCLVVLMTLSNSCQSKNEQTVTPNSMQKQLVIPFAYVVEYFQERNHAPNLLIQRRKLFF